MSDFLKPTRVVSVAPTAQTYAALVKIVLRRRSKHLVLLVGVATYAVLALAVFDPKGLPGSLYASILPALLLTPIALLGTLPLLVLRKQTLTTALPISPSPFSRWLLLSQPQTLHVLLAYLLGGVFLLFAYIFTALTVSIDPVLGIFFYHEGRDAHMVNERWIYLSLLHFVLAGYATVQHVLQGRSHIAFDADASLKIPARLSAKLQSRLPGTVRSVLSFNVTFYFAYLLVRRPALRFVVMNLAGVWARPYLYALMRSNAAFSVSLVSRALASSLVTLAAWETTHICFDVYVTQPVSVSHFARNPQQCLLSGLRSPDPYYQHFAFLELARLTLTDSSRRKAIFIELKPDGGAGSAWQDISRECLKVIGTELQRAKGRGKVVVASTPGLLPPSARLDSRSLTSTHSPVKTGNVFRPAKKTFLDSLLPAAPSSAKGTTTALAPASTTPTPRVPSIFQTSSVVPTPSTTMATVTLAASARPPTPATLEERLAGAVPVAWRGAAYQRVFGLSDVYKVGICVVNRRPAIWAIEALANLLCASLHEDPYGVAQSDIPRVLEAFVLYLLVLESLVSSLGADPVVVAELVAPIECALKDAVRAVLDEFAPYLDSFAFPPKIAAKLQLLVDWG